MTEVPQHIWEKAMVVNTKETHTVQPAITIENNHTVNKFHVVGPTGGVVHNVSSYSHAIKLCNQENAIAFSHDLKP